MAVGGELLAYRPVGLRRIVRCRVDEKPEVVALSKIDALSAEERTKAARKLARAAGTKPLLLSAVSGEGVDPALRVLAREIAAVGAADPNAVPAEKEDAWRP